MITMQEDQLNNNNGSKQSKSQNSRRLQSLEADLNQQTTLIPHDKYIPQQDLMLKSLP